MGERIQHHEFLEETYDRLISNKPRKVSMGVCFVIIVTAITISLLALFAFVLHCVTLLREDLSSLGLQVGLMKKQLEELSIRLDAMENAEFIANQSVIIGSGGKVLLPGQAAGGVVTKGGVSSSGKHGSTAGQKLGSQAAGLNANFSETADALKDHTRILKILTLLSLGGTKKTARVPNPFVWAIENTCATFTCESDGPLNSCLWAWKANGERRVIVIDEEGIVQRGGAPEAGISSPLNGLDSGKCTVQVELVSMEHASPWSCTLLSQAGDIFTGKVNVKGPESVIYFTTAGEGVKTFTQKTSVVSTIKGSGDMLYGIAYDAVRHRLYWTSSFIIYRSEVGRTEVETVLSTLQYDQFRGLAFDWITMNIYVVSRGGFVLACGDNRATQTFVCGTVLSRQGDLRGITLDPINGVMYWTKYYGDSGGSIIRAGMDGSDPIRFVSGLGEPCGITLDFQGLRLYWADVKTKKIQSRNLDGGEIMTITEVPIGPYGIGLMDDRLYWSYWDSKMVQSSSKTGAEIRKVYEGTVGSRDFAVPTWNLPQNRTNHCKNHNCSKVCILSAISFRCLD